MFQFNGSRNGTNCDGASRRDFLKVGALGLGGFMLPDLLRARAAPRRRANPHATPPSSGSGWAAGRRRSKPSIPSRTRPVEFRSTVGHVATCLPGVQFGGVFPKMAQNADKLAVVRSFAHSNSGHGGGTHWVMTGYNFPQADNGGGQNKPGIGAIVSRFRGANNPASGLPTYVRSGCILGDGPSWLGAPYAPFDVGGNARNDMNLKVTLDNLSDRRSLLKGFDDLNRRHRPQRRPCKVSTASTLRRSTSYSAGRATLSTSTAKTRASATVTARGWAKSCCWPGGCANRASVSSRVHFGGWDMHGNIAPAMKNLGPQVDHAVSAFLEDTIDRGLDQDILLVITGEFGRTPRINSGAGRDHWAPLSTLAFAGGGLRMGQVVGESTAKAETPKTTPITPQDLMATVFHVLGMPQDLHYNDPSGRPTPMIDGGKPIAELV